MVNVVELPMQIVDVPVMEAGSVEGAFTVTANVLAVPLPQAFDGVTVILPTPEPTVAVTEFVVVPPVCAHPAGNVQLYVTPATLVTLVPGCAGTPLIIVRLADLETTLPGPIPSPLPANQETPSYTTSKVRLLVPVVAGAVTVKLNVPVAPAAKPRTSVRTL